MYSKSAGMPCLKKKKQYSDIVVAEYENRNCFICMFQTLFQSLAERPFLPRQHCQFYHEIFDPVLNTVNMMRVEKKNVEEKAVVKWLANKECAKFPNCRNSISLENGAKLR